MRPAIPTPPQPGSNTAPALFWAGAVGCAWCALALQPQLLPTLGILESRHWFIDSYAVLAASDAVRQGLDPTQPNPLDPLLRNHKYSDWWYLFGQVGLTRQHNFVVGMSWVLALLAGAWATVRPRIWREALWAAAVMVSPPFLLVVNRANNDLVVFALLAVAGLALLRPSWPRILAATGAVVLATGLKFYPIVAAVGFFGVRPRSRQLAATGLGALATMAAFASVAWSLPRGQFDMPTTFHTFGASILLRDLGCDGNLGQVAAGLGLAALGLGLAFTRRTIGLAERGTEQAVPAVLGIITLLACFVAGISYGYRWIFALWPGIWLWRRATDPSVDARARLWASVASGLLLLSLWLDGLMCAVLNLGGLVPAPDRMAILEHCWRLATQPIVWSLVALLTGWLADWLLACWRTMHPARE